MKKAIESTIETHCFAADTAIQNLLEKIKEVEQALERRKFIANELSTASEKLELALNKIGLTINKENICVGLNSISLTFISLNEKFKFVKNEGYTKTGALKTHLRLRAKAEKISKVIETATGFACNINEFSLELKDSNNRVMCDLVFASEILTD